jgi:hypothetical protein
MRHSWLTNSDLLGCCSRHHPKAVVSVGDRQTTVKPGEPQRGSHQNFFAAGHPDAASQRSGTDRNITPGFEKAFQKRHYALRGMLAIRVKGADIRRAFSQSICNPCLQRGSLTEVYDVP